MNSDEQPVQRDLAGLASTQAGDTAALAAAATRIVPVIEEQLEVGIRQIDRGGYRILKHVSSTAETVDESLSSETLYVERRAIDRLLPEGELPQVRQDGDVLIVPVLEEVLVTVKRTRLIEELHVTRRTEHRRHQETVDLRKEYIEVRRLPAVPADEAGSSEQPKPAG